MMFVAWLFPYNSATITPLDLKEIIYWGISGIFLLYGLKLDLKQIIQDMSNWKLHLVIQLASFLLIPLLVLIFYPFFKNTSLENLWMATFFLAVLPSTVTSSVVTVSIARGNMSAAIFNASISGLIGIIITPLWMSLFLKASDQNFNFGEILYQLIWQIIIPVFIGILLNRPATALINKYKPILSWYDKTVIFIIVYKSFSAAFTEKLFAQIVSSTLITLSVLLILLYFFVFFLLLWISRKLSFSTKDQITAALCGSQKSLVHGSVFVTLIITDIGMQSLFLLPIMFYHSFQLFYASYKARRWAKTMID